MYVYELALLLYSFIIIVAYSRAWYGRLFNIRHFRRDKITILMLGFLPVVSLLIILYTVKVLASFDVVNNLFYVIFYTLLGCVWTFSSTILVFYFFDLSWTDDILSLNNKSALFAFCGAILGLVLIYSGANVGDGPGSWCVIFAGGLGVVSWFALCRLINFFTEVFERITIDRDINCGIRMGAYFLSSGLILARASAGDWTSFSSTIVEFLVGWPAIPLTILVIAVEGYFAKKAKSEGIINKCSLSSLSLCFIYIVMAITSVMMFPLVENPIYDNQLGLLGVIL